MKRFARARTLAVTGLLALLAAAGLAFSGAAFAAAYPGTLTLNGDYFGDYTMGLTGKPVGKYHTITGNGTMRGSITDQENVGVLHISAPSDDVTIAPGDGKQIKLSAAVQLLINHGTNIDGGGVVTIRASNNEANLNASTMTEYGFGTFVDSGTLGITSDNSLGQGWVALVGRNASETASSTTLQISRSGTVSLGANSPDGRATIQPLYLTHRAPNGIKLATIHVGTSQTLRLLQGVGEAVIEFEPFPYVNPAMADQFAAIKPYDAGQSWSTGKYIDSAFNIWSGKAGRLVKTGAGDLVVTEYRPNGDGLFHEIRGMAHTGGTVVNDGTLRVDGMNPTAYEHHFTGFVGSMWNIYTPDEAAYGYHTLMDGGGRVPNYFGNTPDRGGNRSGSAAPNPDGIGHTNNSFFLNGGSVIVDRTQMFSDFNTAAGTTFTANAYALAGEAFRPVVNVMLMRRPSEAAGKLNGSFDLVLNSIRYEDFYGNETSRNMQEEQSVNYINGNIGNAQALLTISNADNEISGQTFVNNGVLAVADARSIGSGNLTVGAGAGNRVRGLYTPSDGKAVFVSGASEVANKTYVNGPVWVTKPGDRGLSIGMGALAAAREKTVSFSDVSVNGAMEINPQAAAELILVQPSGFASWENYAPYPTWGGTVAFGGENKRYALNGSAYTPTQIFVSRGVWRLDGYPAEGGFSRVTLREGAVLSLAAGVRDFHDSLDLQVGDDARIRLTPTASDAAESRAAASAKDALLSVRTFDSVWLGSGKDNKDHLLLVQLDMSEVGSLQKGTWLKLIEAEDAVGWNNLHYLREGGNTPGEDFAKIRAALSNSYSLGSQAVVHVDMNAHTIYLEVLETIDDGSGTPGRNSWRLSTVGVHNLGINVKGTLLDEDGQTLPNVDMTFYLFRLGADTRDNANAIDSRTRTTNENGDVTCLFTSPAGFGYKTDYAVKAVAEDGTEDTIYFATDPEITTFGSGDCFNNIGFNSLALFAVLGYALLFTKKKGE